MLENPPALLLPPRESPRVWRRDSVAAVRPGARRGRRVPCDRCRWPFLSLWAPCRARLQDRGTSMTSMHPFRTIGASWERMAAIIRVASTAYAKLTSLRVCGAPAGSGENVMGGCWAAAPPRQHTTYDDRTSVRRRRTRPSSIMIWYSSAFCAPPPDGVSAWMSHESYNLPSVLRLWQEWRQFVQNCCRPPDPPTAPRAAKKVKDSCASPSVLNYRMRWPGRTEGQAKRARCSSQLRWPDPSGDGRDKVRHA